MKGSPVSRRFSFKRLSLPATVVLAALAASHVHAQQSTEVDVRGYLCQKPIDAEDFQHLASTSGDLSRAAALSRFNEAAEEPRCKWYERAPMIFKGALTDEESNAQHRDKYLFVGGKGGVFEVLVYETPNGAETLYSWRRTEGEAG